MTLEINPEELIGLTEQEAWDSIWEKVRNAIELNSCDKCGKIERTGDLVWLTSEDFTPKEGEIVPETLFNQYDALCEPCYLEEVEVE